MRDQGYVFLMSHMRGHTTVFAYLLASHPEIDGHVEQHRKYETRADLVAMRAHIEAQLGSPAHGRWLLDKILHDRLVVAPELLARPDVRVIVMVRHPLATIASQVRRSRTHEHVRKFADPARAASYYERRARRLASMASAADDRWRFVAAERLVNDAEAVLAPLAAWLGLDGPIPTRYGTFPERVRGAGDTSEHILAGRVLRDDERPPPANSEPVVIPPERLAAAIDAWQDATEAFTGVRPPRDAPS